MATARHVPGNEVVSTYGAGQTYTVLATWEAATDNDLVTAVAGEGLACLAAQYDDSTAAAGATTNSTYFRRIYPQASNFHGGLPDAGPRFFTTANSVAVNAAESNFQVQDVAGRVTNNSANNRETFSGNGTAVVLVGCIADASANAGSGVNPGIRLANGAIAVDCLAFENEDDGCEAGAGSTYMYNCTSVGNGAIGYNGAAGTIMLNCLGASNTGGDFNATMSASSGYKASADATADDVAGIGGNRVSQTFTFVDSANDDYHLASGDGGAKDFGTDLSADGTYAFDDDVDLATRSGSWDIGWDEVAAVAGRTTKNTRAFPLGTEIGMGWVMPTQV